MPSLLLGVIKVGSPSLLNANAIRYSLVRWMAPLIVLVGNSVVTLLLDPRQNLLALKVKGSGLRRAAVART